MSTDPVPGGDTIMGRFLVAGSQSAVRDDVWIPAQTRNASCMLPRHVTRQEQPMPDAEHPIQADQVHARAERVTFRPMRDDDAPRMVRWLSDPDVARWYGDGETT